MACDVAIIGAGPAGSAAALALARLGYRPIVFERQAFPRPKVCGGCLSGRAVEQIRELVTDQPLPGTPCRGIRLYLCGQKIACPTDGRSRVVLRSELDQTLARAALRAGAQIRFGYHAELVSNTGGFEVKTRSERIYSNYVLIAAGLGAANAHEMFARRAFGPPMLGWQWLAPARSLGLGSGEVEMHWMRGGYVGLATPNGTDCIVALAMKAASRQGDHLLEALRRLNPHNGLWDRLDYGPRPETARGCGGFPTVPRALAWGNALLIGDAAGFAEPFTGTGMELALYSARQAAEALLAGEHAATRYARAMRSHRRALWQTRLLGAALSRPWVQTISAGSGLQSLVGGMVRRIHVRSAT